MMALELHDLSERLRHVEHQQSDQRERLAGLESGLRENTRQLGEVRSDTSEIVSLLKGMKMLSFLLKWSLALGGSSFVAWLLGKAFKAWP